MGKFFYIFVDLFSLRKFHSTEFVFAHKCIQISTHDIVYGAVNLLLDAPCRNPTNTLIAAIEAFPADYSEQRDMRRVETRIVS